MEEVQPPLVAHVLFVTHELSVVLKLIWYLIRNSDKEGILWK